MLAVAEAGEVVLLVALPAGLGLPIVLAVLLGLALLPLAGLPVGLPVVLPLAGVGVGCGVAFGVGAGLLAVATADAEELGGHPVAVGLSRWVVAPPGLAPLVSEPARSPEPSTLGTPLALLAVIPTTEPTLTSASCSGGTARAMPMANTAQAIATAGRISPSRQPRAGRRG